MDLPSSRTPVQVRRTVRSGMRGERTNAESPARQNGRGRGRNPEQELGLRGFHCCERRRRCLCPRSRSQRAPRPRNGPQHAHRLQPASRVSRTRREMSALRKGPRERAGVRCNALRRLSRASRRGKPTAVLRLQHCAGAPEGVTMRREGQAQPVTTIGLSSQMVASNPVSNHFRRHAHFFDLPGFSSVLVFSFVVSGFPRVPSRRPPFIGIGTAVFPGACCFVSFNHDVCEFVRIAADACLGHRGEVD